VPTIQVFFNAIKAGFPNKVTWTFPTSGDQIDDSTGDLTGSVASAGAASVTGSDAGVYAAPAGLMVQWQTFVVVHKHRLVGKSFLVPIAGSKTQNDGTIDDTFRTLVQTSGQSMITTLAASVVVWHRPLKAADGSITTPGSSSPVLSVRVPDRVSILRSRRD
jgi:hypothetical protein